MKRLAIIETFTVHLLLVPVLLVLTMLIGQKGFCLDRNSSGAYLALVHPKKNPQKRDGTDVKFQTVDKGAVSGIKSQERLVIKDKEQWMNIWAKHSREKKPPRILPQIDFENDMVLAVFQGEKSGYNDLVQIDRVRLFKDKMVVLLRHENLGASSSKNTLRSYHIVKVPKNSVPVIFH